MWETRVPVEASPPLPECTPPMVWPGQPQHQSPKRAPRPQSPAHSPWQLRPLGASLYPVGGQLHWKLPGKLMQR